MAQSEKIRKTQNTNRVAIVREGSSGGRSETTEG